MLGMMLDMWKVRVVCNLPQESVRISEIAGVAAPVCWMAWFYDFCPESADVRQQSVNLCRGADIVREGKTRKPRALRRKPCVGRQTLA